jgi:hypothetical protein
MLKSGKYFGISEAAGKHQKRSFAHAAGSLRIKADSNGTHAAGS